jgi:hypothetical protein
MRDNQIEDELDAIRLRHYELTKDMTSEERVAYVNNEARRILEPYGICPVAMPVVRWGSEGKTQESVIN